MRAQTLCAIPLALAIATAYGLTVGEPALAHSSVVMRTVGSDDHQTRLFSIRGSEWQLQWSYNCHGYGTKGNFGIEVKDRSGTLQDLAVNDIGWSGRNTEYLHQGGTYYLEITSECAWNIAAVSNAGGSLVPISGKTTVLSDHGSSQHQTRLFRVPSEWQIRWNYDCHAFGVAGNFGVEVKNRSGSLQTLPVNEVHMTDSGEEYMHQAGTFYLSISSECQWNIRVTR